jgi:protein dithiol oxidoreductase (disulfide-forming)
MGKIMISAWKRCFYAAGLSLLIAAGAVSAQPAATLGRDFTMINPAQSTDSGKKIELVEFFWYGCIHCYNLEVPLKAWLKRKPADVEFRYVPAIFDAASWGPMARAFYALDALGVGGKYHDEIFTAIHKDGFKAMVTDPRVMADWFANKGVEKQKFIDAYNSFAVNGRVKRSEDMTRSFDVPGTPALAVDGKFMTGPSMTVNADGSVNYERFFQVLDQLIARARKERAGQK